MQEVATRLERVHEELGVIQQALGDLEGAQAVHVRLEVFRRREVVPKADAGDASTATDAGSPAEPPSADAEPKPAAAAAANGGAEAAGAEAAENEEGEEEEVVIVHETVGVAFTLDLYAEVMTAMVRELRADLGEARELRDAAVKRFEEVVTFFGERPGAVKEHDWWGTVIKFAKLANDVQSAIIKEEEDARAEAERKAKRLLQKKGRAANA